MRYELKAEILLTSLLREKLYSKELEVEQLQAELAAAVRGNDILRCEVQNAMDNLSCVTHKLKDLELQVTLNITYNINFNIRDHNMYESGALFVYMTYVIKHVCALRDTNNNFHIFTSHDVLTQ